MVLPGKEKAMKRDKGSQLNQPDAALPAPIERKSLYDMTAQERAIWYANHRTALEDFCSFAQQWRRMFHSETSFSH